MSKRVRQLVAELHHEPLPLVANCDELGAVAGVLLMAGGRAGRKTAVPFGPFMILGAWTAILGAGELGDYYLELIGV